MTIKNTALCFSILLASFSLQGAYNAYGYGPTPPPTFSGPGVPPPPSYREAINAQPYVAPASYQPASYGDTAEPSYFDRWSMALRDYYAECSTLQIALGSVVTVAALYGMYKTGLAVYASRAAIKHTALAAYHISRLTGTAAGYCLSKAGAVAQTFPALSGAATLMGSCVAVKCMRTVSPE